MSKKIQKRVKKSAEDFENAVAQSSASIEQEVQGDEVLFTLDRSGSKSAKRKVVEEILPKATGKYISATEKKLVERALVLSQKPKTKPSNATNTNISDIWSEESLESKEDNLNTRNKKLKVALPGQSYNPSQSDHQNAVAQGVALQITRDEAILNNSAKVVARKLSTQSMSYEEIGAIPLSDELGGGLRTVLPKGVALSHHASAMRQSGDLAAIDRRTRRAHEKPHGPRRTAWHAKYKYNEL